MQSLHARIYIAHTPQGLALAASLAVAPRNKYMIGDDAA